VSLTADEMNADKVNIFAQDQAGAEWFEALVDLDVPTGNIDTAVDILEGDHIENSTSLVINRKGTTTPVLNKQIKGSQLQPDIEIITEEAP
jgi:crotonobetainyl-CoA:carnitine CoA-transferase CaiB-like acyl-CoA transferase